MDAQGSKGEGDGMNAADWANTVLITITSIMSGIGVFMVFHGVKLLWQSWGTS